MSKYTRLNKINHYHDSGSTQTELTSRLPTILTIQSRARNSTNQRTYIASNSRNSRILGERKLSRSSNSNSVALSSSSSSKLSSRAHSRMKSFTKSSFASLAISAAIMLVIAMAAFNQQLLGQVEALNCYHCSSVNNPGCEETFTAHNVTETDCEKAIGRPAKVCRKIVQYIEHKRVVIRSCGFIDEHEEKDRKSMCNKRSGTFAIMMESCNCYTDLCNHSASLVPQLSVISSLLAGITLALLLT